MTEKIETQIDRNANKILPDSFCATDVSDALNISYVLKFGTMKYTKIKYSFIVFFIIT